MSMKEGFERYKHLELDYKFFHTVWYGSKPKTAMFLILTNSYHDSLGFVKWYAPWRQYCFFPSKETIFSRGCLDEINEFINVIMEDHKTHKKHKEEENKGE